MTESDKVQIRHDSVTGRTEYLLYMPGYDGVILINDSWQFNGDVTCPTFSPSLLTTGRSDGLRNHCFIRNGMVEFLPDCSHAYAGKTIELPCIKDWPEQ